MSTFPVLSSGSVIQYPTQTFIGTSVRVIKFLDGANQRFVNNAKANRKWRVQLDLLSAEEMAAVEAFFRSQMGSYATFTFPDPFTNAPVANCRIASPDLVSEYQNASAHATTFWIVETNG